MLEQCVETPPVALGEVQIAPRQIVDRLAAMAGRAVAQFAIPFVQRGGVDVQDVAVETAENVINRAHRIANSCRRGTGAKLLETFLLYNI